MVRLSAYSASPLSIDKSALTLRVHSMKPTRRRALFIPAAAFISLTQNNLRRCQFASSLQAKRSSFPAALPNVLGVQRHRHNLMSQKLRLRSAPVHQEDDVATDKTTSPASTIGPPVVNNITTLSDSATSSTSLYSWQDFQLEAPPLSIFLLNLVAVIWGSQHAVIKSIVEDSSADAFTLLRFGVAALIASPYTPGFSGFRVEDENTIANDNGVDNNLQNTWRWGAEMGLWMFLGFSFQAIGLGTTTAQRSGFLLYLNVKFVPFFARILFGKDISTATWLSAFTAFIGTALLALDGDSIGFNSGDVWSIAAAAASAMFILRLESASKEVSNSAELNSATVWVVFLLASAWSFGQAILTSMPGQNAAASGSSATSTAQVLHILSSHPLELLYLSGVTTALANYIQTIAQKDVSAERASVIYSLDPVYGAFFSWLLLGETLGGPQAFLGAGLITVAAATNAFLDLRPQTPDTNDRNNR